MTGQRTSVSGDTALRPLRPLCSPPAPALGVAVTFSSTGAAHGQRTFNPMPPAIPSAGLQLCALPLPRLSPSGRCRGPGGRRRSHSLTAGPSAPSAGLAPAGSTDQRLLNDGGASSWLVSVLHSVISKQLWVVHRARLTGSRRVRWCGPGEAPRGPGGGSLGMMPPSVAAGHWAGDQMQWLHRPRTHRTGLMAASG